MASPQVEGLTAKLLEPYKPGRYTVQFSDSITNGSKTSRTYNSVKFNHKPSQTTSDRESVITTTEADHSTLTITDKDGDTASIYTYNGARCSPNLSYVLIFDPDKQTCTLEPLSSAYTFNLQSTPWESSAAKLREQYPQLHPMQTNDDERDASLPNDVDEEIDSSSSADDSNPYDYRHYLNQPLDTTGSLSPDSRIGSRANTPRTERGRFTPLAQPLQSRTLATDGARKARPTATPLTSQRKRKSPPPHPTSTQPHSSRTNPAVPKVRLDRRASTRPTDAAPSSANARIKKPKSDYYVNSDSESDDNATRPTTKPNDDGTSPPARKKRAAVGLGLTLGPPATPSGPISLRSAAGSPNPESRLGTPAHRKGAAEEEEVIDFGDVGAEADEDEDEDDGLIGDDGDVAPLSLGPPAHEPKNTALPQQQQLVEEQDDEDAAFEAEMMQGLASQDEEQDVVVGVGTGVGEESESESEEE